MIAHATAIVPILLVNRKVFLFPTPYCSQYLTKSPMRLNLSFALALGAAVTMSLPQLAVADKGHEHECALDFKMNNIDGEEVDLEDYEGNVVLIVNVASKCGLTRQYAGLQELYAKYKDKGFVIIGFPCNQFGGQEPGTETEIKQFCTTKYDITFPMMSKVEVNGDDAADIYKHLTSQQVGPAEKGAISWNFEKFLIDQEGQLIHRFSPRTTPDAEELSKAIEELLTKESS